MPILASKGAAAAFALAMLLTTAPMGQAEYTVPGAYTWIAPAGVFKVSAVTIGPGGTGTAGSRYLWCNTCYPGCYTYVGGTSGGGGGLGWKNNIPVVPGTGYTVVVGAANVTSYFISAATVSGTNGQTGGVGSWVGDGGGNGGNSAGDPTEVNVGGGGGGAGGYSGQGGWGSSGDASYQAPGAPAAASGGGYGGNPQQGGGGVGIYGKGADAPFIGMGGSGGAGGQPSSSVVSGGIAGGMFGGGGPGVPRSGGTRLGGTGAVRIIWGNGRAFPSTFTQNV